MASNCFCTGLDMHIRTVLTSGVFPRKSVKSELFTSIILMIWIGGQLMLFKVFAKLLGLVDILIFHSESFIKNLIWLLYIYINQFEGQMNCGPTHHVKFPKWSSFSFSLVKLCGILTGKDGSRQLRQDHGESWSPILLGNLFLTPEFRQKLIHIPKFNSWLY